MLEPELTHCDLPTLLQLCEELVVRVVTQSLEKCSEDMQFFETLSQSESTLKNNNTNKTSEDSLSLRSKLESILRHPKFERLSYREALGLITSARDSGKNSAAHLPALSFGDDLRSEHERYLTDVICGGRPVFVTDWPTSLKSFYMRQNETDPDTVAAVDLLVPGLGELIGGSVREERLEVLEKKMDSLGLLKGNQHYQWYLDLRRYGTVPHAGFGLGLERMLMFLTNTKNIRDTIPFPRYVGNCKQ
jgi:asparaginyl-tRNA synthetase